jgi:hypothetical protein
VNAVRLQTEPYPIAPSELLDLAVDVLGWLGWPALASGRRLEVEAEPGGAGRVVLSAVAAPDGGARARVECAAGAQGPAQVLLDEISAAVAQRTKI